MRNTHARLRIVTGKGGVGKTVVATALAFAEASLGKRVLLAEFNGSDSVSKLLEMDATSNGTMLAIAPNVQWCNITPSQALHEYALMTLKFEALYRAVFQNKMVERFIRLIPSLPELLMLGKVWYHEQEYDAGVPHYDVIIADLPATGHALAMLRAPSTVMQAVPPGPLRDNSRNIAALLQERKRTVVHIVTTPEEMPVNEANHLYEVLSRQLEMVVDTTFINRVVPSLPGPAMDALKNDAAPQMQPIAEVLAWREAATQNGRREMGRLDAQLMQETFEIPRIVTQRFGRAEVEAIASNMSHLLRNGRAA